RPCTTSEIFQFAMSIEALGHTEVSLALDVHVDEAFSLCSDYLFPELLLLNSFNVNAGREMMQRSMVISQKFLPFTHLNNNHNGNKNGNELAFLAHTQTEKGGDIGQNDQPTSASISDSNTHTNTNITVHPPPTTTTSSTTTSSSTTPSSTSSSNTSSLPLQY